MVPFKQHSLLIFAGILVVSIAVLAGANLWFLRQMHSRSLHDTVAQSVLNLGTELVRNLGAYPAVQAEGDDLHRRADFSRLVQTLKKIEPSLEYVTVTEGEVTLFHEDLSGVHTAQDKPPVGDKEVRIGRKLLATEEGVVPVLTFSSGIPGPAGVSRSIQVAIRKDAVQLREEQASRMLGLMFQLSLITLAVALGLAVVLVIWVVRHELDRQRRRQDEEHLAFAGLLADGIIHDVRNPMSSLRLDVQMMEKEAGKGTDCQPGRIADLAVRARKTMDRVDLVMREFLYVSKPSARQAEKFDVNACVRDSLDLLGPRFEGAGIGLDCQLSEAPLEMMGHSVGLKRAIINVLTNAKQVSASGRTVRVITRREGSMGILTVEDEGPGIKPEDMKRVFEMFVTGRPDGVGLGLYLAKAAVEHSGGTISVENRSEGGARFIIRLSLLLGV